MRQIVFENEVYPNWKFELNNLCLKAGFIRKDLAFQFHIREIAMTDYCRTEPERVIVHFAQDKIVKTEDGNLPSQAHEIAVQD